MTIIPSSNFSKTNWSNSHRNQCSRLTKNYYEKIIIRDSIAVALSCYQNAWAKVLQHLRALNCRIGVDKVQYVVWHSQNLPVAKNIKKVVLLCAVKNLNQDSPEDIKNGITEVAILLNLNMVPQVFSFVAFFLAISIDQ